MGRQRVRRWALAVEVLLRTVPCWVELARRRPVGRGGVTDQGLPIVVSLTSFPDRFGQVWKAVAAIARQQHPASSVVLNVFRDEWAPAVQIPWSLRRLQRRGLVVRQWDVNYGVFLKVIPLLIESSDAVVVCADDDVLYPKRWLSHLRRAHDADPDSIIGLRGSVIEWDDAGTAVPYADWPDAAPGAAGSNIVLKGYAGIVFPPRDDWGVLADLDLAGTLARFNDDLWMRAALWSLPIDMKVAPSPGMKFRNPTASQLVALSHDNLGAGRNDDSMKRLVGWAFSSPETAPSELADEPAMYVEHGTAGGSPPVR